MQSFRYPCTGHISHEGFGNFLESELGEPRRNINLFAQELVNHFGAPHITLVNSGSSANLVASLALAEAIRAKGRKLVAAVSALTFPTTISSLLLAGFEVHLVDTGQFGFNMDPHALEKLPFPVSLVVPTHFLGFPCDMPAIAAFARERDCLILQDSCEAMYMSIDGKEAFTYGDITTWSFYHPHHLSSYGGGAVICNSLVTHALVDSVAHWGRACTCHFAPGTCSVPAGPAHQFTYERPGLNVELSELNACFGRWQLRHFSESEERRKRNYGILYDRMKDLQSLRVYEHPSSGGSAFVFPVLLENGMSVDDACACLAPKGVEIRTLMGGVVHGQKAFAHIDAECTPNADHMTTHAFFVGIHHTLESEAVREVAGIMAEVFASGVSSLSYALACPATADIDFEPTRLENICQPTTFD